MAKPILTAERLRELLSYNPETGVFLWRVGHRRVCCGARAGNLNNQGYRQIQIEGHRYQAHRLAWLYVNGDWPLLLIDHINGIRDDNRLVNLRDVGSAANTQNMRRASRSNSTGMLGVSKSRGRYHAQIQIGSTHLNLGFFDNPSDAHAAYVVAKRRLHAGCTI